MASRVETAKAAVRAAERNAERARDQLERALAELEAAENAPAPPPKGSVIRFQVQFTEQGAVYTYAALNTGFYWFLTNQEQRYSWDEVVAIMKKDYGVRNGHVPARYWLYPKNNKAKGAWHNA